MPDRHAASQREPPAGLTAAEFLQRLEAVSSDAERAARGRYFKDGEGAASDDVFLGVRMQHVFELSRAFQDLPLGEIEGLLESRFHEARAGGVKIMALQASAKDASPDLIRRLHELYLRRHDRINDWDLVDLGAWSVVGRHLATQPRHVLDQLAVSADAWERRTAILATLFFLRGGDLDDTYRIAEALVDDDHDLVQKAVGGALREAGRHDRRRLVAFLDRFAATMPRVALRYAIEHFEPAARARYLAAHRTAGTG